MTTQTITTSRTDQPRLLTPAEVATLFRVDVKTVTRWANDGRLTSIRTLGGHRRFRQDEVTAVLDGTRVPRQAHAG
jgi:excisionase family DNA binding protein